MCLFLSGAQLGNCGTPLSEPEVGSAPICNCPYEGDDGRKKNFARSRYVCASSRKSLRRLPRAEVVSLTSLWTIITTDIRTKVMPHKNSLFMMLNACLCMQNTSLCHSKARNADICMICKIICKCR